MPKDFPSRLVPRSLLGHQPNQITWPCQIRGWRDRLHVSVRRKVWPCFRGLHKLQNPEGSSFGRQTCHLGGGGNRKCSPGSSTPCLQSVWSGHREAKVGASPGPGTAELRRQKPRRQTQHKPREVTRRPWGEWPVFQIREHVFCSLRCCILSCRPRPSCTCGRGAFIEKPVGMWREVGLRVAPALTRDSGLCSRERKSSFCPQNGKGIHPLRQLFKQV